MSSAKLQAFVSCMRRSQPEFFQMETSDVDLFDAKLALDSLEKNRSVALTNWTGSGLGLKI
jgi:hypothetical protein